MIPPSAQESGVRGAIASGQADLLTGLKVLDLSRVLAGPWTGQMLADFGADVIKVERAEQGDETRSWGPPWFQDGTSAYFTCANRGKRSVCASFDNAEDLKEVMRLAAAADVLIENFKPGQLGRFGLDYASLEKLNPGLIYCSITGFGQNGPLSHQAGYDFAIQAMGGLMSITGEKDREPQKVGVAVIDLATGLYACNAILAAVIRRGRLGKGGYIDCALIDTGVALLANQGAGYLAQAKVPRPMGNAHPSIVPYQAFACSDGHMVLAIGNDRQFQSFCTILKTPWATDDRFATNPDRVKNRDVLVPMIENLLKDQPVSYWLSQFSGAGVPATPIQSIDQVFADPQVAARQMVCHPRSQALGAVPGVGQPLVIDGLRPSHPQAAPELGPRISRDTRFY